MSAAGEAIAQRARMLIGVRFRPQGRNPATGLDCVGTAAAAAGVPADRLRRDYSLRGDHREEIARGLRALDCRPVPPGELERGDVMLLEAGPAQTHLAVCTGEGFVHADAGLGRVVERPMPPPWPLVGVWRMAEAD